MNPLGLLLGTAPPRLRARVYDRLDPSLRTVLLDTWPGPGAAVARHTVTHGTVADQVTLAANRGVSTDVLMRLAESEEPDVAAAVFAAYYAPREALLRAMRSLKTDDLPVVFREDATSDEVAGWNCRLSVLVESDDPDMIRKGLSCLRPDDNKYGAPATILRGCLGLLRTEGPQAVREAMASVPPVRHAMGFGRTPGIPPFVRAALDAPTDLGLVSRALDHLMSMPSVVERLRLGNGATARGTLRAPRVALDWDYLGACHRERPFSEAARQEFFRQPDCPDGLGSAGGLGEHLGEGRRARAHVLCAPGNPELSAELGALLRQPRDHLLEWAYARELLGATRILREGRPTYPALALFQRARDTRVREAHEALAALSRPALGDDPEAWAIALALLPEFTGTAPELLAVAGSVAAA